MRRIGALLVVVAGCGNSGSHTMDAPPIPVLDASSAVVDAPRDAAVSSLAPPTGMCLDGWCWVLPFPQGDGVRALWGASTTDVWVVGDRDTLMHFDGTNWTRAVAAGIDWGSGAGAMWGTSSTDVWAAAGVLLHWDGAAWTSPTTVGDALVVGGTSSHDVLVYDFTNKNIPTWDGTTWTSRPLPAADWRPVSFGGDASGTLCVSNVGGIAKWLGTTWGIADGGTRPTNAAVILDSTHVVIAQNGGVTFWDGTTWTPHNPPVAANFTAITGHSFNDIWVVANTGTSSDRYHWDGAMWSAAAPAADDVGQVSGVWEDPSGYPWATKSNSEVRRYSGTMWDPLTTAADIVMGFGTSDADMMTISSKGVASQWNGSAWTATPLPTGYVLGDIWGSGPNDYWIAAGRSDGAVADRVMLHWDGSSWSASAPLGWESDSDGLGPHIGFVAVWGSAANDVYAVGVTATYHYDGTSWTALTNFGGTDVFGSSAGDVTVVSGSTLNRWNGTTWSTKTAPSTLTTGWQNSATEIWLSGQLMGAYFDGTFFVPNNSNEATPVGATHDMFTFTLVSGEQMNHWTGDGGSTPTPTHAFFSARGGGWRSSSGHIYAVAANGLLVH